MKRVFMKGWIRWLVIPLALMTIWGISQDLSRDVQQGRGYKNNLIVNKASLELNAMNDSNPEVISQVNRRGVVAQVNDPVTVDGLLTESVWNQVYGLTDFTTVYHNQPTSAVTTVKTLYDEAHLYISVQGDSDGGSPAEFERLFILFSTDNSNQKFYQIPLIVTKGPYPIGIRYKNFTNGDIRDNNQEIIDLIANKAVSPVITKRPDGSWTAEMAISFAALGVTSVQSGDEWHMNVLRYFGPDSPRLLHSWVPIRVSVVIDGDYSGRENRRASLNTYVSNEGRLGSLFFNEFPGMSGPGKPTVVWTPENPRLLYQHYTEKILELDAADLSGDSTVQLIWTSPYGEKTVIDHPTIAEAGDKRLLSFIHPAPKENGWYQLQIRIDEPGHSVIKDLHLSFDRYSLIEAGDQLYPMQMAGGNPRAITAQPASTEVANLLATVPERVGMNFIWVPHKPELSERSVNYSWSPANPLQIVSTDSEKIVYPNPLYPENKQLTVTNGKGESVDYPYYEDSQGRRYFLSAHLWYLQRDYIIKRTKELSTTDPLGAARLLYRFAQVYPGWVPVNDIDGGAQFPISPAAGPPYNYYGGMWSRWSQTELNSLAPLADAYAEIKKTNALQLLSLEVGVDVDQTIVNDMFLPSIEFYRTFPVIKSNVEYFNWIGLMSLARALNEPKYMHEAVELLAEYSSSQYMLDGFWKEVSIGYHKDSVLGIQKAAALAAGWTDPVNYESPRSGARYNQLDPGEYLPQMNEMLNIRNVLAYPNRGFFPVNDTWAFEKATVSLSTPSLLKPAAGIAKLTRGTGLTQNQLYMKFSPYNGHDHKDPLNMTLFAKEQELLPDIGYTHTNYRQWTASTLAHNTVVVNGKDALTKLGGKSGGNLGAFTVFSDGVQVVQANQENAYPETTAYGREPWFIGFNGASGSEGYVVDLFRVAGGARHEYTLAGDANRTATFETDLPLTDYGPYLLSGNPVVTPPASQTDPGTISDNQYYGYMYVRDVRSAPVPDGKYEVTMKTQDTTGVNAGLRITGFVDAGDNELFIGESPSLRATRTGGLSFDNNIDAEKYVMPKLVLRREGTDLKSNFVTVMEPLDASSTPQIEVVDMLKSDLTTGEVAVSITYGDTQDIVLSAPNYTDQALVVGDLRLEGKMGFIRLVNGEVTEMRLADGTLLQKGNKIVTGNGAATGSVIGTQRKVNGDPYDALVTTAAVPEAAAGRYVIVTHPDQTTTGYKILEVRSDQGKTLLVLDHQDTGFTVYEDGRSELKYYPMTSWSGTHSFRIANVEVAAGPWPPAETAMGAITGTIYAPGGIPLGGATVRLTGYSTITAATGATGEFSLPLVPTGSQRVTGVKAGYATAVSSAVYVSANHTANVTFTMADLRPPIVTEVTPNGVGTGLPLRATSSKDGYLYLVPPATSPLQPALEAAVTFGVGDTVYGVRAQAVQGVSVVLDTYGLDAGRYTLYAVDEEGRVSSGSGILIMPIELTLVDSSHPFVSYSGNWYLANDVRQIGGSAKTATENGAYVDVPFYGIGAKLLGVRSNAQGKAAIYVDGVYQTTVDNYGSAWKAQQEIYDTGVLAEGVHIIRYERIGEKSPASSSYNIHFDALQVIGH